MRKLSLNILIAFMMLLACPQWTKAQRPVISDGLYVFNSAGNYATLDKENFDWNFGELVLIQTFNLGVHFFTQGFLQPFSTAVIVPELPGEGNCDLPQQINNVITPNGDGRNDYLKFQCLEKFPHHLLTIYDRAGRIIFKTSHYQNDWNGLNGGRPLNEDTYYFVLEAGKNMGRIKGFVSIIRDQF